MIKIKYFLVLVLFTIAISSIVESYATHISLPILEISESEFILGKDFEVKGWIEYDGAPASDVLVNVQLSGPNQKLLFDEFITSDSQGKFSINLSIPESGPGEYTLDVISFCREEHRNICTHKTTQSIIEVPNETENLGIPQWIKNNADWWSKGTIGDSDFISGIQYLINEKIIKISKTTPQNQSSGNIPQWIKNNADWWSKGLISDADFIRGLEHLVNAGIIQTAAREDTCKGDAICTLDTVTRVIDGDTIYTTKYKIRISLTDTPEVNEKGYAQASEFTRNLCPVGSTVLIDQDDLQNYDVHGRLLAAVHCDGVLLNSELLQLGLAEISRKYCSTSEFGKEFWAQKFGCAEMEQLPKFNSPNLPDIKPVQPKTQEPQPKQEGNQNCDPSYPDFCIPPPPPELDCKDISQKNFRVLQPDPHRFDGDKDGIGCEK